MLQFFCLQTKECCNIKFCCPIIKPFESKIAMFFSVVLQEAKKIQKIVKKYPMNISHKISEFGNPFSRKQRKNKTCAVSKYVYNPYIYILTKN